MLNKTFSVIIPTRQRHTTLKYSIQSVLNQTYQDFEIVVMDNCSTQETAEVASSFKDERIKYYRASERLSMSDNWELGLSHATGEYIIIIGDDDALLPDGIEIAAKLIEQYQVDQVTWFRFPYFWPNAIQGWEKNRLHISLNKALSVCNSKENLKLFYEGRMSYEYLPMLYNSFVNRRIIEKIKTKYGKYFVPGCFSPDIYSGIVNSYFSENYLYTGRPLSLAGISGYSTGMSLAFPSLNSKPAQEFLSEQKNKKTEPIVHKDLIPSASTPIVIASDRLLVKDFFFKQDARFQLNIEAVLNDLIQQINHNPQEYEHSLSEIKQLARKWNVDLSKFKIPEKSELIRRPYEGFLRDRNGELIALVVDCQKLGISTVDRAALLCAQVMNDEISYKNALGQYYIDPQQVQLALPKSGTSIENEWLDENSKKLNPVKLEQIVRSIKALEVKQRVYAILRQLTSDRWMKNDLERYAPTLADASWFDSISFLNWYAYNFKPRHYLEVGVRRGRSLAQVLVESPETHAYGFDLWIENYAAVPNPGPDFVLAELRKLGIDNLPTLISGNSHQTLPTFFADPNTPIQEFDLINIDGDHSYGGAKEDLDIAFDHLAPGGALMFDDICHPDHPELRHLWDEYREKFKGCLFIEDPAGTGTGVAFKPPFTKLAKFLELNVSGKCKESTLFKVPQLPIHFFTIVINGEPFIRYHIDLFKKLPFPWHWHIVEGVADLKHDTAWSLRSGGGIADNLHRQGRSKDGTTEYLNELARLYPKQVTIYRKPEGIFWDGKCEMVNAPLTNIQEECLLWQVDVDELWTVEQISTTRQMFINNPEKTAAFYWCWYFVGDNLIVSTRNCYTQNPQQEWLRTWRFKPGMRWVSHEPPRLVEPLPTGEWRDVGRVNPFRHEETEKQNLVFQHFAYVTIQQLLFKEKYYGYSNALSHWIELQKQTHFPVRLREYFPWVQDDTMVSKVEELGIVPLAKPTFQFVPADREVEETSTKVQRNFPLIVIDGVFYQINKTGIARVWHALLQEWANTGFAKNILFLDRVGTAPRIPGIKYLCIPAYDYNNTDRDRAMLQGICDEENANIFISTYYTTPLSTPSVFMAYDMIPELSQANLSDAMWREKHYGIRHASAYVTISENTARDLIRLFPQISPESVTVAHCGISSYFSPANPQEIARFNSKCGISKPYFLIVGLRSNINNYKNTLLFFQAFAQLPNRHNFEIVCVGGNSKLEPELQVYVPEAKVHFLQLHDRELRIAYSGAVALVYPSKYEGFGLPILEASACGCPVITCPNGAIPEVAGQAAIYVKDDDVPGLVNALLAVQQPQVRHQLITEGFERVKQFSWAKMADRVRSVLIDTARQPAKKAIAAPASYSVYSYIEQYKKIPAPSSALANLRQIRQQLAQQWLSLPLEQLETAYLGELGKTHQALLDSGIKNEAFTPPEREFIKQLSGNIAAGFQHPQATQTLLAATLYCYPYQLPIQYENAPIPKWFATDYLKFMFAAPTLFHENGDNDRYYRYLQGWLGYVHGKISSNPDSPVWRSVAEFFTQTRYFFSCPYFNSADLKEINEKRAQIIEFALKNRGFKLDYVFPARGSNVRKIRLGILKDHFSPSTETLATLPVFEHLDRQQFEIILYATWNTDGSLERYCQSCSDRFIKLPETLPAQVQTIRGDDLDILFVGTNLTANNSAIAALALHRLARVQVTSIASPVTTSFPHIDYYIAGNLTAPAATTAAQYREQLVNVEGSGICFRFPLAEPPATIHPTRASWGATNETTVFISGANFYKIIPELRESWVKIIAAVPNSILVLYPFGPAWSNTYPAMPFLEQMHSLFDRYGIQRKRLILINTLPSPADIKECVKLADIYLDSYPYSGATSLLDPLQLGIPAIAWEGNTLRARQGASLLRELQLPDLIANSETAYIELATNLATNPQLRQQYRQQIRQKMQNNPPFLDSRAYAEKLGNLFQNLLGDRPNQKQSNAPELTPQFLNRLIGCANLYYIDPSDESVLEELRQVRREFAEFWLTVDRDRLETLYASDMGKAHQSVMKSGIHNEPLSDRDRGFVEELTAKLATGIDTPNALNAAIALLLYRDRLPVQSDRLPQWIHPQTVASPGLLG